MLTIFFLHTFVGFDYTSMGARKSVGNIFNTLCNCSQLTGNPISHLNA